MFKRRRFRAEIILLCVRWHCRYGISYRAEAVLWKARGEAPGAACKLPRCRPAESASSRLANASSFNEQLMKQG
jgi:hypothetical protein